MHMENSTPDCRLQRGNSISSNPMIDSMTPGYPSSIFCSSFSVLFSMRHSLPRLPSAQLETKPLFCFLLADGKLLPRNSWTIKREGGNASVNPSESCSGVQRAPTTNTKRSARMTTVAGSDVVQGYDAGCRMRTSPSALPAKLTVAIAGILAETHQHAAAAAAKSSRTTVFVESVFINRIYYHFRTELVPVQ
jgi:hypothetical protein